MAQTFSNVQGMFKQRYGRWIDPLPDEHTLADFGDFIPQENRPGLGYNFPVLTGIEHGQTANVDNSAFTLNAAVDSVVLNATLDGATILLQSVVSYDTIYKSLNGTGNGSAGGAYKTSLDQAVQAMLMGAAMYRELALAYGPGTSTALASNIGVVGGSVSGANLGATQIVFLTEASWIPGLWILAASGNSGGGGMRVDIYQTDGSTLRETNVVVQARPSTVNTRLTLFKASSSNTVAANDKIVPLGWRTKSCFGLESIFNNTGTIFGIDASQVAPWRCMTFSAGGQMTRAKIMAMAAAVSINGVKNGGKLFVCAPTFADLAEEASALQRFTGNTDRVKRQGASQLTYETAAGQVEVTVYQYAKQGQAMFISTDNFRRVGSTDLTMRPIGGGAEAFFTHLTTQSGAQMKIFSNQAPVLEMPYRNFLITGIQNNTANGGVSLAA
jgi:hypothetical protein